MPNSDNVLLDRILEAIANTAPAGLGEAELFEYFTASEILKDYDLSPDEILNGIIDGSGDGGIDSLFIFANENLVDEEDYNHTGLQRQYVLDLYIVQSKTELSFGEDALDKLIVSLPQLLNLAVPIDTTLYSELLRERIGIFRKLLEDTASKFPQVKIHIVYASKGAIDGMHSRVTTKSAEVVQKVQETISGSTVDIKFVGAKELREMASKVASETLVLEFEGNYSKTGQNSYISLIPIKKYNQFLTDDTGKLRRLIFESNVRDYQGTTQVNEAIRKSLEEEYAPGKPDFWWLNNGVTIICSEATITGDKFILKDAQIVNGLQTSIAIFDYFKSLTEDKPEDRVLLARVITAPDEETRNNIILSTNRQNPLPPFAMRATDSWQKDIELFFESKGYYYDRRKNYYKNQGKPAALIVTIPYLAQATLSMGFGQPDIARARPSTLIVKNSAYTKIFDKRLSLDGYLWMAKLQKKVDAYLRAAELEQNFKSNMRFHLSMLIVQSLLGAEVHHPSQLQPFYAQEVDEAEFDAPVQELQGYVTAYTADNPGSTLDKIAKSREFTAYINTQKYA